MNKFWRTGSVLLAAALVSALIVGCSGKKTSDEGDDYEGGEGGGKAGGTQLVEMKADGKATLKGKITFEGERPALAESTITKDQAQCTNKTNFSWVIDGNGGVANVFVWVRPVSKDEFINVVAAEATTPEKTEYKVDQPACAFEPHCFVLYPEYRDPKKPKKFIPTGQTFLVGNEMTIAHNASVEGPLGYKANPLVPPGNPGVAIDKVRASMSSPYKIGCTVHPWMNAWFWALEHPWGTVTKADGSFEIKNIPIPASGKMRVVVWHEDKKWVLEGKEMGKEIDLKKDAATTWDYKLSK